MKKLSIGILALIFLLLSNTVQAAGEYPKYVDCYSYAAGGVSVIKRPVSGSLTVWFEGTGTAYFAHLGRSVISTGTSPIGIDVDEIPAFSTSPGFINETTLLLPSGCTACFQWNEKP